MSLLRLYQELKDSPSGHTYTASKISNFTNTFFGVSLTGQPVLLLEVKNKTFSPPRRVALVSLKPGQEYKVSINKKPPRIGLFHALLCESDSKVDIDYFLILIEAFLENNSRQEITYEILVTFFNSMIRLFSIPPSKDLESERQGLWGELFMMREVQGFHFWVPSWHKEVTRIFDFTSLNKRTEVKTTLSPQRIHHFSHRQIFETNGEEIIIVSLCLVADDSGLSLRNLIDECRYDLCGGQEYFKLESAVRHAGMEDESIIGPKYNANYARRNLEWYNASTIPRFPVPEPYGVSETRYKVDLSLSTPLTSEELAKWLSEWKS